MDDEAFEILSPVLAPSAINAEAAILARHLLSRSLRTMKRRLNISALRLYRKTTVKCVQKR